jgi:hypothetical protein
MSWARNNFLLKYVVDRSLITRLWYKTWLYRILAAPVVLIKRRHIYSRLPFSAAGIGIMLALFGIIPPVLWHDGFVFAFFFALSAIFILRTTEARAAANYSIYLYIFIAATLFLQPLTNVEAMLIYLLAIIGVSFLIMNVITEPKDVHKILWGIYIAVVARAIYVSADTIFAGIFYSGPKFSEFLIMLFPFALIFALLSRNKRWRWLLLAGLLPSLYGVVAVLFDIGNVLHSQISEIPLDGTFMDAALFAREIYAGGGTVGAQPFLYVYSSFMETHNLSNFGIRLLLYIGMLGFLLFLWYIIRLIRKAIVRLFRSKGDARIVLIAGISALLGALIIIPFELGRLEMRTMFIYWIIIGIVGGIVKNKIGMEE